MEYKEEKAAVCSWKKIGTTKNRRKMNYFENKQRSKYQIQRNSKNDPPPTPNTNTKYPIQVQELTKQARKTRKSPGMLGLKKVWAG